MTDGSRHTPPRERAGESVVVDTNVFVAAGFKPNSASGKILDAVKKGRLRMIWNDSTRRETERILRRIPPLRTVAVDEYFRPDDRFTPRTHPDRFADVPDPEDRTFAALAHAVRVPLITNDEDLLGYRGPLSLDVVTPSAFWNRRSDAPSRKSTRRPP